MKKRGLALVLALILVLLLAGCGEVREAANAIQAIGKVTPDSAEAIEAAEALFNALTEKQQETVYNAEVLTAARAEYDRQNAALTAVRNAVGAIGTVTADSTDAIIHARSLYDTLEEGLKPYVRDLEPTLAEAEAAYQEAMAASICEHAQALYELGAYADAESAARMVVENYPASEFYENAAKLIELCIIGQIREAYDSGDLETALYLAENTVFSEDLPELEELPDLDTALEKLRPANGKRFFSNIGSGYCTLTVDASSTHDALVKLESQDNPEKYILFYVRAGESATLSVADGTYIVKYTTGEYWFGEEPMFGSDASFTQADDVFEFETTYSGSYVYYSTINITLYAIIGGNLDTTEISAEAF